MFLENVLIPAVLLVNGVTILQAQAMDEVSYFHIELDSHDVLLAESAPSESFIDDGSRGMFHNAAEYQALYPDAAQSLPQYCAPRLEEGQPLEEIRSRLNAHAGLKKLPNTDHGPIEGYLDTVTRTGLTGWARNPLSDAPVRLRLTDNGITLAEIIADQPRPDVGGPYGFSIVASPRTNAMSSTYSPWAVKQGWAIRPGSWISSRRSPHYRQRRCRLEAGSISPHATGFPAGSALRMIWPHRWPSRSS